jgi:DNA integrity scanning protein DisA with diadenylate cyclase activity
MASISDLAEIGRKNSTNDINNTIIKTILIPNTTALDGIVIPPSE